MGKNVKKNIDAQQKIRKIGDSVLHKKATHVNLLSEATKQNIDTQIAVMQRLLSATGGAGIAANQCQELSIPLNIILVGVDYNDPEHVANVTARYPGATFPPVKMYLNSKLIWMSQELDVFPEGCLSVQGPMRALVLRPREIQLQYQDLAGNFYEELFTGTAARVVLHELDHINKGKVYFQRILEELNTEHLENLQKLVKKIKANNKKNKAQELSFDPVLVFKRDTNNQLVFAIDEIEDLLGKINADVFAGIAWALAEEIRTRLG